MTSRKWSLIAAALLLLIGGFILFGPLVHIFHISLLHDVYRRGEGVIAPLLGLLFVYLGVTITRGFRVTLYITFCLLGIVLLFCGYNLFHHITISIIVLLLLVTTALLTLIPLFNLPPMRSKVSSNIYSIGTLVLVTGAAALYGILGFIILGPLAFHVAHPTLWYGVTETVETMVLPNELIDAPTHAAQLFIASIDAVGFALVVLFLGVLIQPIAIQRRSTPWDRRRVEMLLRAYPTTADDYFKLWPQPKRYFFSASRLSCITYLPARRSLFVLGDPNGDPKEFSALIRDFTHYCHERGWLVCVIMPSQKISKYYRLASREFRSVTLGNEARVSLAEFTDTTLRDKHFRYVMNKAKKEDLTVEELTLIDTPTLRRLKHISDEWLRRGRHEYTFFMGHFSTEYLRASRVFVLKQGTQWRAYVSLIPTYDSSIASIDHSRFTAQLPTVGMHYLLSQVLISLQKENVETFNLGLAPLSHIGKSDDDPQQRLLRIAKRLGGRYYSFDGVAQFKGKFDPIWKKSTVLYEGSPLSIPGIMNEFESISRYDRRASRLVPTISITVIILLVTAVIYIAAQ